MRRQTIQIASRIGCAFGSGRVMRVLLPCVCMRGVIVRVTARLIASMNVQAFVQHGPQCVSSHVGRQHEQGDSTSARDKGHEIGPTRETS